jgi:hypothetical protein
LKMKIIFDLQNSYPDCVPFFRLKNLSPDYMDNRFLDRCETLLSERAGECIGSMMLFEMCDLIKEKITAVNDEVLQKVDELTVSESVGEALKTQKVDEHMTYTEVTKESFAIWCEEYMKRIQAEKLAKRTSADDKPTGKQLFQANKNAFEDLTIEDEESV